MKNRYFYKIPIIQILFLLLLFCGLSLTFLLIDLEKKSKEYINLSQSPTSILTDETPIIVDFGVTEDKVWTTSSGYYGAQYEGAFTNNTMHKFTDWTVTIVVPEGYWIDSNWNADFSYFYTIQEPINYPTEGSMDYYRQYKSDKNLIVMKKPPVKDNKDILVDPTREDSEKFKVGMIMYSKNLAKITQVRIQGRFIYSPFENPLFYILTSCVTLLVMLIAIFVSIQISVLHRIKNYERRQKEDNKIIIQAFKTFANFVDAKDKYTNGHSIRVAHYAKEIAKRLGLKEEKQKEMFWLGLMHDVGKIGVSDQILNKEASLTSEEYKIVQEHTTKGYDILSDFTTMPLLKDVAKHHHERYDGTGYCDKLKGDEIPLEARIICICDCFDAMNSDRCYRKKLSRDEIIKEIKDNSNKMFDPTLADIMLSMIYDKSIEKLEAVNFEMFV